MDSNAKAVAFLSCWSKMDRETEVNQRRTVWINFIKDYTVITTNSKSWLQWNIPKGTTLKCGCIKKMVCVLVSDSTITIKSNHKLIPHSPLFITLTWLFAPGHFLLMPTVPWRCATTWSHWSTSSGCSFPWVTELSCWAANQRWSFADSFISLAGVWLQAL